MKGPMLSIVIALPLLGALLIGGLQAVQRRFKALEGDAVYVTTAIFTSTLTFLFTLPFILLFNPQSPHVQFIDHTAWLPAFGASYSVGLDSFNILFFALTAFLGPLACLAARKDIRNRPAGFYAAMLVMESALLGVFAAQDFLLFYIFWELSLVPMFLIILLWGGERRRYAAIKFFLYTFFGSLLMLVSILWLHGLTGGSTFAFNMIAELATQPGSIPLSTQLWLFTLMTTGFLIKIPAIPFHTWLPAAHVEAPTPGSVMLAGVLLKMGAYGLVRFSIPFFPDAAQTLQKPMVLIGVAGVLYGAWAAFAQTDMKRLVAYSSVAHMGLIIAGIFTMTSVGTQGALLEVVSHGITTGGLFMVVGFIYTQSHTRDMNALGGLATKTPWLYGITLVLSLSAIGLPLTSGFIGEFLVLWGGFQRYPIAMAFAVSGILWSAVYMLRMIREVFHGPVPENLHPIADVGPLEKLQLMPLMFLVILIGLLPSPVLKYTETAARIIAKIGAQGLNHLLKP